MTSAEIERLQAALREARDLLVDWPDAMKMIDEALSGKGES